MKIAFIFPPAYDSLYMPHITMPTLLGYLREAGYNSVQYDLNIEVYDRLLKSDALDRIWKTANWDFDVEPVIPHRQSRLKIKESLAGKIKDIVGGIDEAVSTLRSPEKFYDREKYIKAVSTLEGSLELINAAAMGNIKALGSIDEAAKAAMDPKINIFLDLLKDAIKPAIEYKPGIAAIIAHRPEQMVPALAIAQLLKKSNEKVHVVLSGVHPTLVAHAIEASPKFFEYIDSVALNETEVAHITLAKTLKEGNDLSEVPGILHLHNGKVARTSLPVMEDAEVLPTPNFDNMQLKSYLSPEPVLPVFSTRGCYWRHCVFCLRADRKTFSQRSPQQVVKDFVTLKRNYGARAFWFVDNAIRPRKMSEISEGLIEAGLETLWTAKTRFSPEITWDWGDQIAAGGCARLIFDIESSTKRIVDIMDKGFRLEETNSIIQGLAKSGIDITLNFQVGFPTEKVEEVSKTNQFIDKISDTLTPYARFNVELFPIRHGSQIYLEREKFKVVSIKERPAGDMTSPDIYDFETSEGMTRAQAIEQYRTIKKHFAGITDRTFRVPHDMLHRQKQSQEKIAKEVKSKNLKMSAIPKLADDLRAEKGYLVKNQKRFRIDESLRSLIDLLDGKRNVKEVVVKLSKSRSIPVTTAFIYAHQLFDEGIIVLDERE